ncbi:hypothetical protein HHI36_001435 [Cryptolaemus montrouzieri]|uniref:Uncharacterized protein n=1 Tax=Cryptolaemus montrouzieri TaxID=559131 RepID=A0ABD2P7N1_9CUCU
MYFLKAGKAMEERKKNQVSRHCDDDLLRQIDQLLRERNPTPSYIDNWVPGTDRTSHAAPSNINEIGAVSSTVDGNILPPGTIRLQYKGNSNLFDIPKLSPICDPLY